MISALVSDIHGVVLVQQFPDPQCIRCGVLVLVLLLVLVLSLVTTSGIHCKDVQRQITDD